MNLPYWYIFGIHKVMKQKITIALSSPTVSEGQI